MSTHDKQTKDAEVLSQEQRQASLAPETHNDEQDDHDSQAQEVAEQALDPASATTSPTESTKPESASNDDDSTQDLVDHMRDMEGSGRIDMGAFRGEPNHDDNEDKFGEGSKLDDMPSDGS